MHERKGACSPLCQCKYIRGLGFGILNPLQCLDTIFFLFILVRISIHLRLPWLASLWLPLVTDAAPLPTHHLVQCPEIQCLPLQWGTISTCHSECHGRALLPAQCPHLMTKGNLREQAHRASQGHLCHRLTL